jgi:hypothetical protein
LNDFDVDSRPAPDFGDIENVRRSISSMVPAATDPDLRRGLFGARAITTARTRNESAR